MLRRYEINITRSINDVIGPVRRAPRGISML
jgi:hypothetical protein